MKFPGEERFLIETYLRSLILFDFMEQPSVLWNSPQKPYPLQIKQSSKSKRLFDVRRIR